MRYIFGNFKMNKSYDEMKDWLKEFKHIYEPSASVTVGVFPQFPFLAKTHDKLEKLPNVVVGSQTLASDDSGSFTGEVSAQALKGVASYVIIGHSERRKYFSETNEILAKKVECALKQGLTPIYCVRDEHDVIPSGVRFIAYEPVAAIGTGKNEPPSETVKMKKKIKLPENAVFIYGGSVNAQNAKEYFATGEIDGFLIGKVTLSVAQFLDVVNVAKT